MKLIDIINKVCGTQLNVTVTEPVNVIEIPNDKHYVLNYQKTGEWLKDRYVMIKANDEAQASRLLLNNREDVQHFGFECEIEDIIQDSESDNLMFVKYTDNKWNSHYIAVNAAPSNVLKIVVERCQPVKSAGFCKKIDEVIV